MFKYGRNDNKKPPILSLIRGTQMINTTVQTGGISATNLCAKTHLSNALVKQDFKLWHPETKGIWKQKTRLEGKSEQETC